MKHLEKSDYLKMLQKLEIRGHKEEDSRWMKMWDEIRTDINPKAKWYDTDPSKKEVSQMGTNYYAVSNRPTTADPIHIGKSSIGWKFLFQSQNDTWNKPPVVWNTYDQVYEWLYKNTVESDAYVIMDEYDEIISFNDFVKMVEDKQTTENDDNFTYSRNVNGYRFSDNEFC